MTKHHHIEFQIFRLLLDLIKIETEKLILVVFRTKIFAENLPNIAESRLQQTYFLNFQFYSLKVSLEIFMDFKESHLL